MSASHDQRLIEQANARIRELEATIARLRAVARAVLALDCCGGDGYRACEAMGAAISALAPGDLGASTFDSSPDACRDSVHDSYYDEGFAAANWLRWCDAWVAIGLAAALVNRLSETGPGWPARYRDVLGSQLGIPAAEAK